ncbi:hypothetical protein COO60DRAFT_1460131 [Scenedesmus sp. NREL 46B-D3]|nr:hypothetical protein COO60DRAFT_1460131 [Scenedesmus sp. NREL 46B-D3]
MTSSRPKKITTLCGNTCKGTLALLYPRPTLRVTHSVAMATGSKCNRDAIRLHFAKDSFGNLSQTFEHQATKLGEQRFSDMQTRIWFFWSSQRVQTPRFLKIPFSDCMQIATELHYCAGHFWPKGNPMHTKHASSHWYPRHASKIVQLSCSIPPTTAAPPRELKLIPDCLCFSHAVLLRYIFLYYKKGQFVKICARDQKFVRNLNCNILQPDADCYKLRQAVLSVQNSSFISNNSTYAGALLASDQSRAAVAGSRFEGGGAQGGAAAVVLHNSSLSLADSIVLGNTAGYAGGGLLCKGNSSVTLSNSLLHGNNATFGGGIDADADCRAPAGIVTLRQGLHFGLPSMLIVILQFVKQTTSWLLAVHNCSFHANNAANNGGAVKLGGKSAAVIRASHFDGNIAMWGGGVSGHDNCTAELQSTMFFGHRASERGAGLRFAGQAQVQPGPHQLSTCNCSVLTQKVAVLNCSFTFVLQVAVLNCSFHSNVATTGGGAVSLQHDSTAVIRDSALSNNTAESGGGMICADNSTAELHSTAVIDNHASNNGGGLLLWDAAQVAVHNCTFNANMAVTGGGGVSLVGTSRAVIRACLFVANHAAAGAGAYADGNSTADVQSTTFAANRAGNWGGGLHFAGATQVAVLNCSFRANTATSDGGALSLAVNSRAVVRASTVSSNTAKYGGGMACTNNSTAELHLTAFTDNRADIEAGALAVYYAAQVKLSGSMFTGNQAGTGGGALRVDGSAALEAVSSQFIANKADLGGALIVRASVALRSCAFNANTAARHGGAMYANGAAKVLLNNCSIMNGSAESGGAVAAEDHATVAMNANLVRQNSASTTGGGLWCAGNSSVTLTHMLIANNSARGGAGIVMDGSSYLNLSSTSVEFNSAAVIGGGLGLLKAAVMHVDPMSVAVRNKIAGAYGGGMSAGSKEFNIDHVMAVVANNTAEYDDDVSVAATTLTVLGNASVADFVNRPGAQEGVLPVKVVVTGLHGLPCEAVRVNAEFAGMYLMGTNVSGVGGLTDLLLRVQQPPGHYNITFLVPDLVEVPPATLSLRVRHCVRGEVAPSPDTCLVCLPGTYSLDPSQQSCQPCPAPGASCPGGAAIVPEPGWRHSAADSAQMHSCPNPDACSGDRTALRICGEDATCRDDSSYNQLQCNVAYTSNVCGKCAAGFGSTGPFKCRHCMKPAAIITLYVVSGIVLLGCIKLLLHLTLADNFAAQHGETQPPAELMRCLVLYSQRMLIVASLGLDWPATMEYPLRVLAWVWATSSPETLSVDCILPVDSRLPLAVQRVLFYLGIPVVMLVALLIIEMLSLKRCCVRRRRRPRTAIRLVHRLGSTAMAVLFFFLPSLQRTVFGLFACIPLDQPASPPYVAIAVGSFWVFDTSTLCFGEGWHKALALGLGVLMIALLCVVLPAVIIYTTLSHTKRLGDASFGRSWGFLTHAYHPKTCWWEAVVVCENAVLVAISVFGVNLGPFYQCLLMVAALLLMSQLQLGFRPYLRAQTGRAMAQGTHCLLLTALAGHSFLAYGPVQPGIAYGLALGAVLLLVNLVYACSVVWQLLSLVDWLGMCDAVEKRSSALGRLMRRVVVLLQRLRVKRADAPAISMAAMGPVCTHGGHKDLAPVPTGGEWSLHICIK